MLLLLAACAIESGLKHTNGIPQVAIATPVADQEFRQGEGAFVFLTGTVSDREDAPLELEVTLQANGVATPFGINADGDIEAELDVDTLPLGDLTLVLSAVDTQEGAGAATVVVQVRGPSGPPTVTISTPEEGASFEPGDLVAFRGSASDLTTPAAELDFAWASDLDGPLPDAVSGAGESAVFANLSLGTHVVTLTATDTEGEVGSDTVTVIVEEEPADTGIDEEPDEVEPGDVMFSEMMVNPEAVADEVGEWVELYNTSSAEINIGNYTFRDDDIDSWELEGPILVPAHGYVVLCANTLTTVNGGVPCDGSFWRNWNGGGLALANGPDELVLARPDGLEIDWLAYDETWFTIAVAHGVTQEALEAGDNDSPGVWCDQRTITAPMTEPGTPGQPNDPC